jgi:hypothetical protein
VLLDCSIDLASRLVVQSDIRYYAQLARIDRLKACGCDIAKEDQMAMQLKQQLDGNSRWLNFLRSMEVNASRRS